MARYIKMALILSISLIILTTPFSAHSTDGQVKIAQTSLTTFPITINKPGSYVLTGNLVVTNQDANAIEITVNDVTLDLNGYTIQGPNTGAGSGNGIYALNQFNIIIKNGRLWGFSASGISLEAFGFIFDPVLTAAGHRIEGIQASNNTTGIVATAGYVSNVVANNNSNVGIFGSNSIITHCTANNNTLIGIHVSTSTITNCIANYNGADGIFVGNNSLIEGNNIRSNGRYGIVLEQNKNYLIQNIASDNVSGNFWDTQPGENYMPTTGNNANYGF